MSTPETNQAGANMHMNETPNTNQTNGRIDYRGFEIVDNGRWVFIEGLDDRYEDTDATQAAIDHFIEVDGESTPTGHEFDADTDKCGCGGQVIFFEDGDDDGEIGHGCEAAGTVFENPSSRKHGR